MAVNSPAEEADLREGDEIVWCDNVINQNPSRTPGVPSAAFKQLLGKIKDHENEMLPVYLRRGGELVHTIVYPRKWHGAGLTGITIVG